MRRLFFFCFCRVALRQVQAAESTGGARLAIILAVAAALLVREALGILVRVVMAPELKVA
jgi:hypothetical protein